MRRLGIPTGIAFICALPAPLAAAKNPIPHPHPQITEVLFNVPTGAKGDANGDGERDAAGDEFIEIANPHSQPINLRGYTLTNRLASPTEDTGKGVKFVFPDVTLNPGDVAVVFNGYKWNAPEGVGDAERAPTRPIPACAGALVFTMNNTSPTIALRNSGDYVLLSDPQGAPIDTLSWGDPDPAPPREVLRAQSVAPAVKGSLQRLTPSAKLVPHPDINGAPFSPGVIPAARR